jgi:hypothetical protein
MATADLPSGFDPEKYERGRAKESELVEGVNLVQHDPETGFHLVTKLARSAAGVKTRCWHCYKQPDGTFDCFEIKCPWNVALTTKAQA